SIMLVLVVIFWGSISTDSIAQTSSTNQEQATSTPVIAHFHLSGVVSESPVVDPFGLTAGQVESLKSLVGRIDQATEDNNVKAMVLTFDGMSLGYGQLEEIRSAINRFKAADKKVYVHAEGLTTYSYALLCVADRLSVAPQSSLWLIGLYGESLYLRSLLNKIGVQADYLHMGEYKSAAEMLTRTSPSDPARENINWLLDGIYDALVGMIAQSRNMSIEEVKTLIDQGPYLADQSLEKGLIDAIETREEFLAQLKNDFDQKIEIDNRYGREKGTQIDLANPFSFFTVLSEMFSPPKKPQKEAIGVIYIEGVILPGHSQPTLFGQTSAAFSGDIRKALQTAAEDNTIKAVVMRIDSPGGSAEASEVILNASRFVQARKPLIVSMGNIAGSGGYYITCAADIIFADEATITASIGVVGGKLVTTSMWNTLGVNWVGYKRGANSDLFNSLERFDDAQRQMLTDYMQAVYDVFKGHVTSGRGSRLRKPIDEIAGGRVYIGKQALELGLIDHIGGLKDAIDYAASKASIKDYEVRVIPRPKDFITILMEDVSGEGESPTDITLQNPTSLMASMPTIKPFFDLLRKTEPERAEALYQALQRIELIRREGVIMMMPFDLVFGSGR
ncbi:MAG: S49 family peptidase, partial [Sedimentisphaerales bacterium]|nr:S49 family peptidase [Sedimentisphaerales bacterium]